MALFSNGLIEATVQEPVEATAEPERGMPAEEKERGCVDAAEIVSKPDSTELAKPRATLRDVRAARSLLYNRLLLEVVQRRIENAEAIILSYLLTQGSISAQIGPYLVELDEAERLDVTKVEEDDGWRQLHIPEQEGAFTE